MIFDEDVFPLEHRYKDFVVPLSTPLLQAWQSAPITPTILPTFQHTPLQPPSGLTTPTRTTAVDNLGEEVSSRSGGDIVAEQFAEETTVPVPCVCPPAEVEAPQTRQMTTGLQRGIRKLNPRYALLTKTNIPTVLKTITAALKHPGWTRSMVEEMEAQPPQWNYVPCS